MRWTDDAKRVAYRYPENKSELARLLAAKNKRLTQEVPSRSGKISKPTEVAAMAEYNEERILYLTRSIQAVEYALRLVEGKPQGQETVRLWEMVYRDRTHRLYGAAIELNLSERTARRYNAYLIRMIAMRMGIYPTDQ